MVDEDPRFISFVSFTFAEMDLRHLFSNLHHPLQFKLNNVSYRHWHKNWYEEVMSIYDIGMMTAVEFWECRSSLRIYLYLLWFDQQFFIFFYYDRFSAVEKIYAKLAMGSARLLKQPLNSPIWHPKGRFDVELFKTLIGYRLSPCHQAHGLNFAAYI
jgi:hypothetical protein